MFENTDVNVEKNGKIEHVSLNMSMDDVEQMKQNMARFKTSCEQLSNHKMIATYDFITIKEPITSLSHDNENGYFVAPENIEDIIDPYLKKENYDHIFICVRLGDNEHQNDIQVNDWIGLGGMDYLGIGFSNIRLPNSSKSYAYRYDERVNTFPEEVFIHEFLHSLERDAEEYGYSRPKLHDYAKYGYKDERLVGLKKWYKDYMNGEIKTSNGYIGLDSKIYSLKPNNEENFIFSYKLQEFVEPENLLEKIKMMLKNVANNVKSLANN